MTAWTLDQFPVPAVDDRDRFHDFALPLPIMRGIADLGFEYCTPVQSEVLPYSLADYDVTGQAQTGTGKTAAFLITILAHQWERPKSPANPPGTPRALVLAPTRELAIQIEQDGHVLARLEHGACRVQPRGAVVAQDRVGDKLEDATREDKDNSFFGR